MRLHTSLTNAEGVGEFQGNALGKEFLPLILPLNRFDLTDAFTVTIFSEIG